MAKDLQGFLNALFASEGGGNLSIINKFGYVGKYQFGEDALMDLGYDDMFQRLWEFYLCYCQGGFEERAIGVAQLLWAAPQARRAPLPGA